MKNVYLFVAAITLLLSLKVEAQISCGINLPQHTGCIPFAILATANDNSPYPILERRWRLNSQSGQLIYSTPIAPGVNQNFSYIIATDTCATFYLSLWSKNTNGDTCVAYDTVFVAGNPKLQPVLAASCNSIPKTVTLYPNATTCAGVLDTFVVEWGCGQADFLGSVPNSITHTYTCPGGCNDILIVIKNSYGCSTDTTLSNVCFNTPVNAGGYISADTFNCPNPPQFIQYYDTSSAHTSGTWDFGDGTSSAWDTANHIYTLPGNYVVKRIVCNGVCCDTAIIDTVVIMGPYIKSYSYSSNRLCACQDTLHLRLEIVGAEDVVVLAGCNTGFITYPPITPIGTEQNPTIIEQDLQYCFTDSCQLQVVLIGPGGCQTYYDLPFIYVDTPAVDFSVTGPGVCSSGPVCFTDLTTYAAQHDSTILSIWNFGDGSQSDSTQSPCHVFTQPGMYNVTLRAFSDKGCSSSITKQVPVNMPPVAGFTAQRIDTVCNRATWMFVDTSVSAASAYISLWNFGDGQSFSSVADTLYHTYTDTGSPVVKLRVTDIPGCMDTAMISIPVSFDQLQVQANSVGTYDSCLSYTRCFSFTNTVGNATNWQWVIDGVPANGATPCKTYHTDGQYTATVYVTDGQVCTDTQTVSYSVYFLAHPYVSFYTIVNGNTVEFMNVSNGQFQSFVWNFSDGSGSTLQNPTHTYAGPGTYQVTLTVTDVQNCVADTTIPVMLVSGINEIIDGALNVRLTPNPFSSYAVLQVDGVATPFELCILNLLGEKLLIKQGKPNEPLRIDRDNLPAGVYVYEVTTRSGLKATGKLVVE